MIIIDVEIEKAILGRDETPVEGIEYCDGWRDFKGMGVAVACTYDIRSGLPRVFFKEDLPELSEYVRGKPTAGFNTLRFDIPLLREHGVEVGESLHFDMLDAIWKQTSVRGGWGLDAVCHATLGVRKTGNGAAAPIWWQQGKRSKVIDYCLNDVWMEGLLLKHIVMNGRVCRRVTEAAVEEHKIKVPGDVILACY